jgi:hypothetical protein
LVFAALSFSWCTRDNVPELTAFVLLMIDPYRQTALVQVFIRLLQTDLASLQYLLGVSYLADQAFEKAKECFCRAAAGVGRVSLVLACCSSAVASLSSSVHT